MCPSILARPLAGAVFLLIVWSGVAQGRSPSWTPDMPPEIHSWRQTIHSNETYQELVQEWRKYASEHPQSAMAQVQLSRALRYSRSGSVDERQELVRKALELDPECPEALEEMGRTSCFSSAPMLTKEEGREYLLRAVKLAPDWPEPHFTLWSIDTIQGRHDEAQEHMRSILAKGGFPAPLADYAYNMLASAEPEAIMITNGDNDTYPPLALQATYGTRRDVAVVNLSLLQVEEYAYSIWGQTFGKKGPFTRQELAKLHESWQESKREGKDPVPFSRHVVQALIDKVRNGEWSKPVYFATTVSPTVLESCDRQLVIEGLLCRVSKDPRVEGDEDCGVDAARTAALFRDTFRMDSATDFALPWASYSAVARLMKNYAAVLRLLATEAGQRGEPETVAYALGTAIRILDFHGETEMVESLAQYWKKLDPKGTGMDPWLEK